MFCTTECSQQYLGLQSELNALCMGCAIVEHMSRGAPPESKLASQILDHSTCARWHRWQAAAKERSVLMPCHAQLLYMSASTSRSEKCSPVNKPAVTAGRAAKSG